VFWALAAVVLGVGTYQSAVLNFWQYDNNRYPYVYAHTSRQALELVREIEYVESANPRASIAVMSRDQFPLSWYLREYPAGYYGTVVTTKDPLVVASIDQITQLDASLGTNYDRTEPYTLRPGVRLVLYVRRDMKRPSRPPGGSAPSLPR
jgi:hypothetical protein